jgi:hypothetical protein
MTAALHLLTPAAALLALCVVVPLALLLVTERRNRRLCALLGLPTRSVLARLELPAAVLAISGLLGVAAAQPVLRTEHTRFARRDAQAFVVVDTSRSMAAQASPASPARFQRAVRFAERFRAALPEIPAGVASFTDRVVTHLLATSNIAAFDATLQQAIGIDRPPPAEHEKVATSFSVLPQLPQAGSFSPRARRRLLVLLTDGESQRYTPAVVAQSLRLAHAGLEVVRFWGPRERVFVHGVAERYRPDPASTPAFAALGHRSVGGRVFGPRDVAAAAAAARTFFGTGPTGTVSVRRRTVVLTSWVALAALLPGGLALIRSGGGRTRRSAVRSADTVRNLVRGVNQVPEVDPANLVHTTNQVR